MSKYKIVLVLEDLRSIYNVGAILRTCDGLGMKEIVYIGTTPYPKLNKDSRLQFMADKQTKQIAKTSLGAEQNITGDYFETTSDFIDSMPESTNLIALEQTNQSIGISEYSITSDTYLVVGNEVTGVSSIMLKKAKKHLEIPMNGKKESFNVEVAVAIAIYQLLLNM